MPGTMSWPSRINSRFAGSRNAVCKAALFSELLIGSPLNSLSIQTNDLAALGTAVPSLAQRLGVHLTGFSPDDESLESVFRYLVAGR